jgi:hypothetical protein
MLLFPIERCAGMRATYADCRLLDPLRQARHHGVVNGDIPFLMSTPANWLRAFLRCAGQLALVLAFAGSAAAAGPPSVSLTAAGHPEFVIAAVWRGHVGTIELGLDSELYAITADQPATPLLLRVQPAQPGARITVRQRSVTYLNLSEDGPHIAVPGTEGRSTWTTLTAASADSFQVQDTAPQTVRMDRRHLTTVLADQPTWLKLAKSCRSQDDGACYTVTDPEFEITVTTADGRSTRAIVRVEYPNGC